MPELAILAIPGLPDAVGAALAAFLLLAALLPLAVVLWRDLDAFEVDFLALGAAALGILGLVVLLDGIEGAVSALALAALFGTVAEAARWLRPGLMGAGDAWLFAALGLAAGPGHAVPALVLLTIFGLLAALHWSRVRGKRPFRSMFPAAVAFVPAMAAALALRLIEAAGIGMPWADLAVPMTLRASLEMLRVAGVLWIGLFFATRLRRPARSGARAGETPRRRSRSTEGEGR